MDDILIPLAPFLMVVAIVAVVFYFNSRNRAQTMETVREAIRAGQTLDPETVRALGAKPDDTDKERSDVRGGLVLMAVAGGLVVLGWGLERSLPLDEDTPDLQTLLLAVAAIPGLIGLVLFLFGLFSGGRRRDD